MEYIVNGDYMYRYSYYMIFLFMLDIALMSLLYFMIGLSFSSLINDHVMRPLNRSLGNLVVFIQSMAEILLTILAIYFVIHFVPKVPSIVPNPPKEHIYFRTRGGDILLAFSIVAAQLLYLDKLRFLYNDTKDSNEQAVVEILGNWAVCQEGGTPENNEFRCQT